MKKFKKNPKLMREAFDKADQERDKATAVQRVINDMVDAATFISSANVVVEEVKVQKNLTVKPNYARI